MLIRLSLVDFRCLLIASAAGYHGMRLWLWNFGSFIPIFRPISPLPISLPIFFYRNIYIYIYMRVFWKPFWTIYDTTRSITIYLELNFFSRESCSCIYHYWWTISSVLTSSWYHFVHFHHPQLISGGLDIFLLSLLLFLLLGDQNESGMMLIRLLCDSDLWIAGDDAELRLRAAN